MAQPPFTVGLVQMSVPTDRDAAVDAAISRVRDAAKRGAQIVCLPELFNAPYFAKSLKTERFDLAEPIPGPTTEQMAALARELEIVIIVPMYERQAAGVYRNSAAIIDADGSLLGVYHKMHIPHDPLYEEKYYFAPGDATPDRRADKHPGVSGFRVWRTRYATIGVLICWDQWYPEAARITSLLGADVLFYPTAIGWHPAEKEQWGAAQVDAWRTIQRSHAIASNVYVAAVNRIGFEPEQGTAGLEFHGHSFICDPAGVMLASAASNDEVLVATCDPARIEEVRRHWPFLRDRRVDAYGPITQRWLGP
jgi:N-carbamoylputrescine amidase